MWMAIVTGCTVIGISCHSLMFVIHLILRMTRGSAGKYGIISRVWMTISAGIPMSIVFP
jgi:hypothetical protein